MNTKKKISSFLFLSFISFHLNAQNKDSVSSKPSDLASKKFYYQFGLSYNLSSGTGSFTNNVANKDGSSSKDYFLGSYGKGTGIFFSLGKKLNKNLGLEIEACYLAGSKNKEKNQYYVTSSSIPYLDNQDQTFKSNTIRFNPKIVFEIPFKKENAFYSKIGYLVGFGNGIRHSDEQFFLDNGQTGKGSYEWRLTGGMVSGSTMALGIRVKVEKNLSFFAEISNNNTHRTFRKSTMIQATENGTNVLDSRSVYSKETDYVDKATYSAGAQDPNKPYQYPAYRSNYSSVGLRIGFIKHF